MKISYETLVTFQFIRYYAHFISIYRLYVASIPLYNWTPDLKQIQGSVTEAKRPMRMQEVSWAICGFPLDVFLSSSDSTVILCVTRHSTVLLENWHSVSHRLHRFDLSLFNASLPDHPTWTVFKTIAHGRAFGDGAFFL